MLLAVGGISGCRGRQSVAPDLAGPKRSPAKKPKPDPRSELQIIDSHVHLSPSLETMRVALQIFSKVNVRKFAVKSAGSIGSPRYQATLGFAKQFGANMAFFANLDWTGVDSPGWGKREAKQLSRGMQDGASGIKIFKALGLGVRLKNGKLLAVDDPRLDPIFERAAETGAIIAWHVADPVAFFKPPTPDNERYEELSFAPDWSFYGKDYPSHEALLAARDRVLKKHPKTTFLGIHLANHPEDLDYVDKLLKQCPNLYVDIAARVPEIGRHPAKKVRRFFIEHQDRILFGTDLIVTPRGMQLGSVSRKPPTFEDAVHFYRVHRRFFETADRQFDHPTPVQGKWKIDAIDLPLNVLKKIYYDNAQKLIFSKREAFLKKQRAGAATESQRVLE